jgi:hypothetical protein
MLLAADGGGLPKHVGDGTVWYVYVLTYTDEPGYNDIGLCVTPSIPLDTLQYQSIPHVNRNVIVPGYNGT